MIKNTNSEEFSLSDIENMKMKLANQRRIKNLLKNIVFYVIFIWTLFVLCFSFQSTSSFNYQLNIKQQLKLDGEHSYFSKVIKSIYFKNFIL